MSGKIKGITIEIGGNVQPLNKALGDVNKKTRDVQSELKQVERLLKLDPKNTELVAQKQKLLADAVENSKEKLDRLKTAQEQVNEQFRKGEISEEQYRAFQREVVKAEQDLSKFEKQLKDATSATKNWEQSLKKAGDGLKNAGAKMTDMGKNLSMKVTAPIVAAGGAILALGVKAGQTADRLLDLSDITGLTTDTIQEYQYVANQAGVESEAMTAAVEGLIRKIPQLESEGGKATEQLAKLGISYKNLKKMSPDKQVDTLINSLSNMRDPMERNAIGAQLFGGAWKDIAPILGMGADGIKAAREEAHELGLVLDRDALEGANEFRKEMDRLKAILGGVINQLGARLAPVLKEQIGPIVEKTIIPALQSLGDLIANLVEWFASLSPGMQKFIFAAAGLAAALGPVLMFLGFLVSGLGSLAGIVSSVIGLFGGAAAGGGLAAVFAAITGPIGIAIAAIAALVAAGVLIYKNWDKIKETGISIWKSFADFFVNIWETIKKKFFGIWNSIIKGMEDRINKIVDMLNLFVYGVNKVIEIINRIPGVNIGMVEEYAKVQLPRLADGGILRQAGLALVGEAGPELVNLPQGAQVYSNRETREMIGQGDTFVFHVHMDEIDDLIKFAKVQKDMRRNTRMGVVMG